MHKPRPALPPPRNPHRRERGGAPAILLLLMAIVLGLGIAYGIFARHFDWWPNPLLNRAVTAADALWEKLRPRDRYDDTILFLHGRHPRSGVLRHDRARAFDGYTLFTSGHAPAAFLIDMDGNVVHQWRLPFSQAWPDPPHVDAPLGDGFVFWRKAHLFPNGDVIAVFEASGDTPYGYGMIKVDKDSKLLWRYAERTHHDVDVGPDGRIYALIHHFEHTPLPDAPLLQSPYLSDSLVVLSPEGVELQRISIPHAFVDSPYERLLQTVGEHHPSWDAWHTNGVDAVTPRQADLFPFLAAGDALISIRSLDLLAAISTVSGKVSWAMTGPWHRQHDPDLLPNGHLMVFDNTGHAGPGGLSRIIEVDPGDARIAWQYAGSAEEPFETFGKGSQQRLPNDNVLITESYQGRVFEIDREGEIVWEFVNPTRVEATPERIAVLCWAQRHGASDLPFLTPPR